MPIRLGEPILFLLFIALIWVVLPDRRKSHHVSRRAQDIAREATTEPTVITQSSPTSSALSGVAGTELAPKDLPQTPTGTAANVAGRSGLFRCEEIRIEEALATRVFRVDSRGRQRSGVVIHREPFRTVVESLISVAA